MTTKAAHTPRQRSGMGMTHPGLAILESDTDFVTEAARLSKRVDRNRKTARDYVFVWLLVLAEAENTTPGQVLAKLQRVQPSAWDQRQLVARVKQAIPEITPFGTREPVA